MDAFADPLIDTVVVMSSAQVGKPLAIDTPIATPQGWSTMGELNVGDTVFGADGAPIRVSGVSEVKVGKPCYRVVFSDGAEITADAEHLWYVESDTALVAGRPWGGAGARSGTLTTEEIARTCHYGTRGNRNRYAIPVAGALDLPDAPLPIDPYVLGAWLGDGHSASARIYCHEDDAPHFLAQFVQAGHRAEAYRDGGCFTVRIDPKQDHICPQGHNKDVMGWSGRACAECNRIRSANRVRRAYGSPEQAFPEVVQTLPRRLSAMGLIGNKHIPAEYLRASTWQRFALLQGLMDTDGYVDQRGRCEFVTTSEQIAGGFGELLTTLGIKFTQSEKQPSTTYKGEKVFGRPAVRFSFLPYADTPVFRLPRKLARQRDTVGARTTETKRRRIVAVEPTPSVHVRCIMVDAPDHLFLAGRAMIPTHNTEVVNNVTGAYIHQDPSPILLLQPTLEMAEAWSKDRLAPMLRDTPVLRGLVKDARARDSNNTLLHKQFPGGHITMAGANSPASLASRPIRVVLADEVDRYPSSAGTEGDPVNLARKRTATFWNRKVGLFSTPTVKGASRIAAAFLESDQRRYFVPCPHCGEHQHLQWAQVQWPDAAPEQAAYACRHCAALWTDADKNRAVRIGEWRATAEGRPGVAGFHLNELYSPWRSFAEIVRDFLSAKQSPETLKTWVNTSLGETWEEQAGEKPEWEALLARCEPYAPLTVPRGGLMLACGVDTQDNRLAVTVKAYGAGEESWLIWWGELFGDPALPDVWQQLDEIRRRDYPHASGATLRILATAIDSGGHHTQAVYDYARRNRAEHVLAIKGASQPGKPALSRPSLQDLNHRGQQVKAGVQLWTVGVDGIKSMLYGRMKLTDGPGAMHWYQGLAGDYFRQLTAEKLVTRFHKGFPRQEWHLPSGQRNEALDTEGYAYAAALYAGLKRVDWQALADSLGPPETTHQTPPASGVSSARRTRGSSYLTR